MSWLKWIWDWLFGSVPDKITVPDESKNKAPARLDVRVVEPTLETVQHGRPWYYTPSVINLLELIRLHEAGAAGYNADYRNDDKWKLENYTLNQVIALAKSQVSQGEASSAIGGYQFLSKTLESLKNSLNLTGLENFNSSFQDDLAVALMIRRGLMEYIHGNRTLESFCNSLAMEWASLPVVTTIKGSRGFVLKPGQSYYAGDGLNKAFHTAKTIMDAVRPIREELSEAEKKK